MVPPEQDNGVIHQTVFLESCEQSTHLGIGKADTGSIVPPNFQGEGRILIGILSPSLVFHEFAGTMPGRTP